MLLLFAYSLGLAVPFVLAGLAFGRLTSVIGPGPAAACGSSRWSAASILVVFGVLLVTDHLGWISTQFATLLDHIGLQPPQHQLSWADHTSPPRPPPARLA